MTLLQSNSTYRYTSLQPICQNKSTQTVKNNIKPTVALREREREREKGGDRWSNEYEGGGGGSTNFFTCYPLAGWAKRKNPETQTKLKSADSLILLPTDHSLKRIKDPCLEFKTTKAGV